MILGIGSDLANIERIAATLDRFGDRFRNRVFTGGEQEKAERRRAHRRLPDGLERQAGQRPPQTFANARTGESEAEVGKRALDQEDVAEALGDLARVDLGAGRRGARTAQPVPVVKQGLGRTMAHGAAPLFAGAVSFRINRPGMGRILGRLFGSKRGRARFPIAFAGDGASGVPGCR
jgi:hypothetical protein